MDTLTHTELHTHLMGMLSFEGWMKFLDQYNYYFRCNEKKELDFEGQYLLSIQDILDNKDKYIEKFTIPQGHQVEYTKLSEFYSFRSLLLKSVISGLELDDWMGEIHFDHPELNLEENIYLDYLEASLKELIEHGVKYTEISFSNAKLISKIVPKIDPAILDKINVQFLLSTNRSNCLKDYRQSSRHLEDLLSNSDVCAGFDIMGSEAPLTDKELEPTGKFSFKSKLEVLLDVLTKYPNTVLRIHSGETPESEFNTLKTLEMIDELNKEHNFGLENVEIRIGHGIHIIKSPEFIDLLKKYHCIVEINASSNFALSNIKNASQLLYKYYLDNDIPIVLSTDGHGNYDTSVILEDVKAQLFTRDFNSYKKILDTDSTILNDKLKIHKQKGGR